MFCTNKHLFLFLTTCIIFIGCKKKDDDSNPISYDYATVEAYSHFLPGSYWVYRDTLSGVEDCVYVYQSTKGVDTIINGGTTNYYHHFYVKTQSTISGYTYEYYIEAQWTEMWNNIPVWRGKYKPGDFVGSTFLSVFPLKLNHNYQPFTSYGSVSYKYYYDSLSLYGNIYYSVIKFNDTDNITEGRSKTNFYISKYIGIVRKEIIDSSRVWDLVRYNVLQ